MNNADAKDYLSNQQIPQLFESLLTGLMYHRPDDPVDYLEGCLKKVRELGGPEWVRWDTFVTQEKRALPPLNVCQARRAVFRNALPDGPAFALRRYDRLPPIHQFSIESDTDLTETAELIEEYTVFDPTKPRPWIILLIGGPGSGKGTQSLKIARRYGFEYISVGELLRKKMIQNTTCNRKWRLIAKIITHGEMAPQETTITEIKQHLMQLPDARGIVIDGFPRDVAQVLSFEDQICSPDLVVFLACPNYQLRKRLETRAELQGRPDDNPKAIQRRLATFKQNTIPLVKYFQERGLIVTLDASRNEEEVFYDLSVAVDNKLFPSKEPAAGPSELDLSFLLDSTEELDVETETEDQGNDEATAPADGKTEEDWETRPTIFVVGDASSGRGSPCDRVAAEYGFTHLRADDLVQGMTALGDASSRGVGESGEQEQLVPRSLKDSIICGMDAKGFIIDGYPWAVEQAVEFERKIVRPSLVLQMSGSMDNTHQGPLNTTRASGRTGVGGDRLDTECSEAYQSVDLAVLEKYRMENTIHKLVSTRFPYT
ncbi:adenylate kinase isoenzyme 5 [Leucoraja erinacea]|uniref:adenylate kinase isoenzyme 5 n=1 Tax=Leucoraja erinaceus TaxID=7782 RepID=UPI0024551E4B|nr:adenylate kinase isoenzyme 5 [Leucoraja erinacea]